MMISDIGIIFFNCRDKNDAIIEVIGGQNNENLPPDELSNGSSLFKKKYTVNKKRSAQESFDRLRKHVPAIQADPNASQLECHALPSHRGQEFSSDTNVQNLGHELGWNYGREFGLDGDHLPNLGLAYRQEFVGLDRGGGRQKLAQVFE